MLVTVKKISSLGLALLIALVLAFGLSVANAKAAQAAPSPVALGGNEVWHKGDSMRSSMQIYNKYGWRSVARGTGVNFGTSTAATGLRVPIGCTGFVYTYKWNSSTNRWDVDTAAPGMRKYGPGDKHGIMRADRKYWIGFHCGG